MHAVRLRGGGPNGYVTTWATANDVSHPSRALASGHLAIPPGYLVPSAAWLHLRNNPPDYETVRRVLGHRNVETTRRFYCGREAEVAILRHEKAVLRANKETHLMAKAAFGRRRPKKRSRQRAGG